MLNKEVSLRQNSAGGEVDEKDDGAKAVLGGEDGNGRDGDSGGCRQVTENPGPGERRTR